MSVRVHEEKSRAIGRGKVQESFATVVTAAPVGGLTMKTLRMLSLLTQHTISLHLARLVHEGRIEQVPDSDGERRWYPVIERTPAEQRLIEKLMELCSELRPGARPDEWTKVREWCSRTELAAALRQSSPTVARIASRLVERDDIRESRGERRQVNYSPW